MHFLILYTLLCVHIIGSCFNWCYSWESDCLATVSCLWPKTCPHDWRSSCINWLVDDQFIFSHHQQPQCFPRSHSYWQAIHWTLCRMVFLLCICKHFHFSKKKKKKCISCSILHLLSSYRCIFQRWHQPN